MSTEERRQKIIAMLRERSPMAVNDIIDVLDVTPATVRRDLTHMERSGIIIRTRGAAQLMDPVSVPGFSGRNIIFSQEKLAIAKTAAQMIRPGESVMLDSGTTTHALANQMANLKNVTVITNSLPVATSLANTEVSTIVTGGVLLGKELALVGPEAEQTFEKMVASTLFLATTGIRGGKGLTTFSPFQSNVKKAMIRSAQKVVLLADSSKFAISGAMVFAEFSDVDVFVTSKPIEDEDVYQALKAAGTELIVCQP